MIRLGAMGGAYNRDGGAENPYKSFVRKREDRRCVGDINIDFMDENELTFQKCFVMV